MSKIVLTLGTRPEIIKLSPIIRECERRGMDYSIVHTDQHYSDNLSGVFFSQLGLPEPEYNLGVESGSHAEQTGQMLIELDRVIREIDPDLLLVQGDTNTVLAGGITASKLDIELGHIEAGLRSFDKRMPEEINRVVVDHVSDYLFTPTNQATKNLENEGICLSRIYETGNTVVDAVEQNVSIADEKSNVLSNLELDADNYILVTAHRQNNVDDETRFSNIFNGVQRICEKTELPAVFPIHPRARQNLEQFDIKPPSDLCLIDPLNYLDFLKLQRHAMLIITDSGGVQEEACILGSPCITVRDSTERPETVEVGANLLVGTDPDAIVSGGEKMIAKNTNWNNPFGDGTAAQQILNVIDNE